MPHLSFPNRSPAEWWDVIRPWLPSLILLPLCIQFAQVDTLDILRREVPFFFYGMLDSLTLVVHEAGHFVFRFFGRFLMFAGGTILQLLLPLVLVWHFYVHDYRFGVQCGLLWFGQSCVDVSIYAGDAQQRILPLLGDNLDGHDWHNMLGMLGLLDAAPVISGVFYGVGLLAFGALLILPRFMWT
ncbi:MAG: hypothetical protein GVY18_14480 [Bacteroidetes bacterium]|jgi:hypothetical protein|nr:hypothetical protein [Bacteroidota bacterium]